MHGGIYRCTGIYFFKSALTLRLWFFYQCANMLGSHKMTPGTKLKEAERAMIKMTMAAKIPIFLFMEIVIHSF